MQERYVVAKNEFAARRIIKRVLQKTLEEDKVLFRGFNDAIRAKSRLGNRQYQFSVFKINWNNKGKH